MRFGHDGDFVRKQIKRAASGGLWAQFTAMSLIQFFLVAVFGLESNSIEREFALIAILILCLSGLVLYAISWAILFWRIRDSLSDKDSTIQTAGIPAWLKWPEQKDLPVFSMPSPPTGGPPPL